MLNPVVQLRGHRVRNVDRVLGDEIYAHTFGPDKADDLFDLLKQGLWCIVEQQMRLIKEENELRLVRIANFRKRFEQFGKQPQKECGIELWAGHESIGSEDIHHAPATIVASDEVADFKRWFTKEILAALRAQLKQCALNAANRLL